MPGGHRGQQCKKKGLTRIRPFSGRLERAKTLLASMVNCDLASLSR